MGLFCHRRRQSATRRWFERVFKLILFCSLGLNQLEYWTDRLRIPLEDGNHSGTYPQLVPGFADSITICGFKRDSSKLDSSTQLLNSWDIFFLTLPSTSSETCMMYSSAIPETDVLYDWLFLGCSFFVSLETAANFRLFLNVAIFRRQEAQQ